MTRKGKQATVRETEIKLDFPLAGPSWEILLGCVFVRFSSLQMYDDHVRD